MSIAKQQKGRKSIVYRSTSRGDKIYCWGELMLARGKCTVERRLAKYEVGLHSSVCILRQLRTRTVLSARIGFSQRQYAWYDSTFPPKCPKCLLAMSLYSKRGHPARGKVDESLTLQQ